MKILVINAGSSSLKYQLINMSSGEAIAKGLCERIGIVDSEITHETCQGVKLKLKADFPTHKEAFDMLKSLLLAGEGKVIDDLGEISAVGHRVVHGGEKFVRPVILDDEVLKVIESLGALAPLHNPANATAIIACREAFGKDKPQVAVFDTAFHQTMPAEAYLYGVPYEYYEDFGIRRYGFHGTSHNYVSARLAEILGKDIKDMKIITCHLGNGSSVTAIKNGKSVDTSMGFTPLPGLIMGTRAGDIDPSIISFLMENHGMEIADIMNTLNKKSGFLGISGISSDGRDIRDAIADGNKRAALVIDILGYQIKKYIGAYAAAMNGVDAVIFTGGIGENDKELRGEVCADMSYLGIEMDDELNMSIRGKEAMVSKASSAVAVWVVPTNEELMIAKETLETIK